ncbi:hypothetical protein NXX54_01150 [Bacteroides sp. BFG-638]|uniref:hypothetical protein n=1 Tax=unclassified Bacteroides TaxID=2646097 RepID=UPI0021664209|nr:MULTISPECIES: hypothetical protein [unclassified Bacteroides]MCS2947057.1 hypothetical protein [Bacteroides sp. BFG-638]MCS3310685.1 hypothetical protein [Bacteroides sp. BFG-637]
MNKKFDFSEIDEALPAAEKMQEQEHIINALENNYEAVRILSANVEKLENRLSEALPKMDGAVSSLRGASTVTVGEEARKTLEREGGENLPEDGRQDGTGVRKAGRTPLGE